MLQRENRLKKMKDWDTLFKEGRFVNGDLITLKVWKIEEDTYPRRAYHVDDLKIGFVVSKKIEKSAVKRNRIKRQMREVVRLLLKEGKITSGYMVGMMAKSQVLGKSYDDIEQDVYKVLQKARLLT